MYSTRRFIRIHCRPLRQNPDLEAVKVRLICAWCGEVLEEGGPGSEVSHGMCTRCALLNEDTPSQIEKRAQLGAFKEELGRAARSDTSVLITGESGSEIEWVVRFLYQQSHRSQAPLITVTCNGVPDDLLESELFGQVESDLAGALERQPGAVELAHGGTLVIRGIEDLSLHMQALLFDFLDTRVVQRPTIGGASQRVDVRVIATADSSLMERIAQTKFRSDLFYRLNVLEIRLPPLRERIGDVALLANHFMSSWSGKLDKPGRNISDRSLELLQLYSWPGNVRELQNIVERALIVDQDGLLGIDDLPSEFRGAEDQVFLVAPSREMSLEEVEKEYILIILNRCGGNRQKASKILGITTTTLWRKLKSYNGANNKKS